MVPHILGPRSCAFQRRGRGSIFPLVPHILLVDDSKTMRQVLRTHLMGSGYDFLEADSGRAALDVLSQQAIDLVISDVRMEDIDGIALTQHIRKREDLGTRVAIILISGDRSASLRARSFLAGADEFLEKPLDPAQLQSLVEGLLVRSLPPPRRTS